MTQTNMTLSGGRTSNKATVPCIHLCIHLVFAWILLYMLPGMYNILVYSADLACMDVYKFANTVSPSPDMWFLLCPKVGRQVGRSVRCDSVHAINIRDTSDDLMNTMEKLEIRFWSDQEQYEIGSCQLSMSIVNEHDIGISRPNSVRVLSSCLHAKCHHW